METEDISEEDLNFQESFTHFFTNLTEAEEFIYDFEEATQSKFILYNKSKEFGKIEKPQGLTKNIHWQSPASNRRVPILFDGSPFMYYGHKILECHLGRDRDKMSRQRKQNNKSLDSDTAKKTRKRKLETKKVGCQARIYITQILRFVNIQIKEQDRITKENAIKVLEDNVKKCLQCAEMQFYVKTPSPDAHICNNVKDKGMLEKIDERIVNEVENLVKQGNFKVSFLQSRINTFVKDVLFCGKIAPEKSRRRYYPKYKDYCNIIQRVKNEAKSFEENGIQYVELIQSEDADTQYSKIGELIEGDPIPIIELLTNEEDFLENTEPTEQLPVDDIETPANFVQVHNEFETENAKVEFLTEVANQVTLPEENKDLLFCDETDQAPPKIIKLSSPPRLIKVLGPSKLITIKDNTIIEENLSCEYDAVP